MRLRGSMESQIASSVPIKVLNREDCLLDQIRKHMEYTHVTLMSVVCRCDTRPRIVGAAATISPV